jgi:hypothetical protein
MEKYPRYFVYMAKTSREAYKEAFGKHNRGKFKASDLNGHKLVWAYCDRYDSGPSYTPHMIMGVTSKYVYVSKKPVDTRKLTHDRADRDKYYRLDRTELESGRRVYVRDHYRDFVLEPDLSGGHWEWEGLGRVWWVQRRHIGHAEPPADVRETMKELRQTMQREHPDRGGDPDKFMAARDLYESLKKCLT